MPFDFSKLQFPLEGEWLARLPLALLVLFGGALIARLAARAARGLVGKRLAPQEAMIVGRLIFYSILGLAALQSLHLLGVDLKVLVGAAGVVTIALGFAAQTSASNLISGLFLMGEKPFVIGDLIQVGTTVGEVISIDLLSVKLRTLDNLLVRLPNETLLKSEIKNLTRFPIRRLDLPLDVDYKSDLDEIRRLLDEVVAAETRCLVEPAPQLVCLGFGESAVRLRFSVWTATANAIDLHSQLLLAIKKTFEAHTIGFPFPHRTVILQTPSATSTPAR